jgi:subtilase family serine protease
MTAVNGCLGPEGKIFNPQYPSNCPYVTSVGGTMLYAEVRRLREVVGETTGAGEVCGITTQVSGHYALRILDCLILFSSGDYGVASFHNDGAVNGCLGPEGKIFNPQYLR